LNTYPLTFKPKAATQPESTTCAESASFALRVLDSSMEPEFSRGCLIVIDPSVNIYDGAYVLADIGEGAGSPEQDEDAVEYCFRQVCNIDTSTLTLKALEPGHTEITITTQQVVGVVVQRAGLRRSYSKHYKK